MLPSQGKSSLLIATKQNPDFRMRSCWIKCPSSRTLDAYFMACSEGDIEPRPSSLDLVQPGTSIVVCTSQYYVGLAKGLPQAMRGLWGSSGALSFSEWLSSDSNREHILATRRTLTYLGAGNHRRHGHFQKFPLKLLALIDPRSSQSLITEVVED